MGVFTFITQEQLAEFLSGYELGRLERFEGIQQGVSNTNYHVWTDRGHYILTVFEDRTDAADLPFFFAFTEHLYEHGIACPRALVNRWGEIFGTLVGKAACLVNFLEGQEVKNADLTPEHCHRMGTLIGRMHNAAKNFLLERSNALSLPGWQTIGAMIMPRADEIKAGLSALLQDELAYLIAQWPTDVLPRWAVHADLFPDNVLFGADDLPGVLDFYYSCTDFLVYDLALTVNAWCFDEAHQFVPVRFNALFNSYEAERPLTAAEGKNFNLMCRGAAIRIIVTRTRDWLFPQAGALVKAKDPLDYVARLEFHRHEPIDC